MNNAVLEFFVKRLCCLVLLVTFACADSIELRDGRHLQGKYLGGTTTAVSFMTDRGLEYLPVSNVLVLIFDNSNVDYRPSESLPRGTRTRFTPKIHRKPARVRQVLLVTQ